MKVALKSGEDAELEAIDGNIATMKSPQAFAPGSPIRFSVSLEAGTRPLEARTVGSRRTDETHFEVRMRFVNLRREDREALLKELG